MNLDIHLVSALGKDMNKDIHIISFSGYESQIIEISISTFHPYMSRVSNKIFKYN
jgi:hypothetical protein